MQENLCCVSVGVARLNARDMRLKGTALSVSSMSPENDTALFAQRRQGPLIIVHHDLIFSGTTRLASQPKLWGNHSAYCLG